MRPSLIRPLSVGEILDRSFQIYRQYFPSAFLLMLVTVGPLYLIYNYVIFDLSGLSGLFLGNGLQNVDDWVNDSTLIPTPSIVSILLMFVGLPIAAVLLVPISVSGQLHLVRAAMLGERPPFSQLLKHAVRPYWKMIGNTLLFALAMVAVYMVMIFLFMIIFALIGFVSAMLGSSLMLVGDGGSFFGLGLLIGVLFAIGYVISLSLIAGSYAFFGIRFGFFLPLITLTSSAQSVTLGESWKLTKGSFRRIFGIMLVMGLLNSVLSLLVTPLLLLSVQSPLLGQLMYALGLMVIAPINLIAYGVVYHDLLVRTFGIDLQQRLMQMSASAASETSVPSTAPFEAEARQQVVYGNDADREHL